jgi:hypothetical protein
MTAGQLPDSVPPRGRRQSGLVRVAWFLVLVMMLAAAAWSISGKLTSWGMDWRLAWALSLMFDLAGLICAGYARRAIERGSSAGLARLAVFGFTCVSGSLSYSHGQDVGGAVAAWGLASISGAVELLFELHRRDVRDEQRAARGLIAERLPQIPLIGWMMYPGRSWGTLRAAVGARLDHLDRLQQHDPRRPTTTAHHAQGTVRSAVRAAAATLPDATPQEIAAHLTRLGIPVDPDTVRALRDHDDGEVEEQRAVVRPLDTRLTDTVRKAIRAGITTQSGVAAYVQAVHGDQVNLASVDRLRRRALSELEEKKAAKGA